MLNYLGVALAPAPLTCNPLLRPLPNGAGCLPPGMTRRPLGHPLLMASARESNHKHWRPWCLFTMELIEHGLATRVCLP